MKKMILMCMIVSLLLTAPSVLFAGGQNEAVVEQEEQITLQYWSWDPDMKGRNESLIAAFEAENPGISVEMTTLEPNEYWTKIRIMANQKKLPDVFNLSSGYVEEWSKSNLLMDLGPMISSSDSMDDFYFNLFDGVKDLSGTDTYYAFPYALVTTVLYYNMDMFDEAGLSYPDSSWDWDDFLQAAKALTRDLDGNGTIDQWGYWFYGRYAHIEPWVYANNGRLIDRQTMQFAPDAQGERALKFLTDLVLKHQVAPSKKEMSAFRQQDVFPNGAAAMFIDGSWNIDNNRIVAGDTIRWGIAEVPVGPSGDGSITYGWPDSLAIASNAKHPEAAWKFMSYAAGAGQSIDMVMAGKIPSYRPLTESPEFLEIGKQPVNKDLLIMQAAEEMRTSFTLGWGEWRGYGAAEALGLNGVIDGIIDGELEYEAAMKIAQKNVNAVLGRYYK